MLMQQVASRFAEKEGQISANNPLPKAIALTAYAGEINQQKVLAADFMARAIALGLATGWRQQLHRQIISIR